MEDGFVHMLLSIATCRLRFCNILMFLLYTSITICHIKNGKIFFGMNNFKFSTEVEYRVAPAQIKDLL